MKEKSHKDIQSSEESLDIMKSCSFGLHGVHFTDEDLANRKVPKEYQDVPIRYLYPDIEETSEEILNALRHESSTKGD